jgi:hypothetical protein
VQDDRDRCVHEKAFSDRLWSIKIWQPFPNASLKT